MPRRRERHRAGRTLSIHPRSQEPPLVPNYKSDPKTESGELPRAGTAGHVLAHEQRAGWGGLSCLRNHTGPWTVSSSNGERATGGTSESLKPTEAGALSLFGMYSHCNRHFPSSKQDVTLRSSDESEDLI